MSRSVCLVTRCHQAAAVAASVRVHGVPSPWLLCDDHATMLSHPDLPAWCEVDLVRPISDVFPVAAEEAAQKA